MALSMSMGNALQSLRLRDFIQDIRNGAKSVPKTVVSQYITAVLTTLRGQARECTAGKQFATLEDLIKLLKKRFTPVQDYPYYADRIGSLTMKQNESVGAFYDNLNSLVNAASSAFVEDQGLDADQASVIIQPLQQTALGTFTRGLPADIAKAIVIKGWTLIDHPSDRRYLGHVYAYQEEYYDTGFEDAEYIVSEPDDHYH